MTNEQIKSILNECKDEIISSMQDRETLKAFISSHSSTEPFSTKDVDILTMSLSKSLELCVRYVDKVILKLLGQNQ